MISTSLFGYNLREILGGLEVGVTSVMGHSRGSTDIHCFQPKGMLYFHLFKALLNIIGGKGAISNINYYYYFIRPVLNNAASAEEQRCLYRSNMNI